MTSGNMAIPMTFAVIPGNISLPAPTGNNQEVNQTHKATLLIPQ